MRKDKVRAYELRRQGRSYGYIKKQLHIPKSTLSGWFKNESWSFNLKEKLSKQASLINPKNLERIREIHKKRWSVWRSNCQEEAEREFSGLKNNLLFVAGIMLYWGEGDKSLNNCNVSLSNSDPELIKLFYSFLTRAIGIPKESVRVNVLLYPDLIDAVQKNFWSKAIGIPLSQFTASTTIKGRSPTKRISYGVCILRITNKKVKLKILKWIELFQKDSRFYS